MFGAQAFSTASARTPSSITTSAFGAGAAPASETKPAATTAAMPNLLILYPYLTIITNPLGLRIRRPVSVGVSTYFSAFAIFGTNVTFVGLLSDCHVIT